MEGPVNWRVGSDLGPGDISSRQSKVMVMFPVRSPGVSWGWSYSGTSPLRQVVLGVLTNTNYLLMITSAKKKKFRNKRTTWWSMVHISAIVQKAGHPRTLFFTSVPFLHVRPIKVFLWNHKSIKEQRDGDLRKGIQPLTCLEAFLNLNSGNVMVYY